MTDVHDKKTRSKNMSRIKYKDTKPELVVRKYLFSQGLRYRIHVKNLPGKPDIVLPKYKTVIFIHGCFFHGHENCPDFKWPKSNVDFWKNKIMKNKERDEKNNVLLKKAGWKVITIFECQLKAKRKENTLKELVNQLKLKSMNKKINNLQDVHSFASYLIKVEGISLHPDDDFNDYININTGKKIYTQKEAEIRNKLMDKCFEICENENADIYDIMHDALLKETKLKNYISSPEN